MDDTIVLLILLIVIGIPVLAGLGLFGTLFSVVGGYFGLAVNTVSAPNFQANYERFKQEETAMQAIEANICEANTQLAGFKTDYGANSSDWSRTTKQDYEDLQFVKAGYVSKYNSLVANYNAERSDFIKNFGRDPNLPREYAAYSSDDCSTSIATG